MPHCRSLCLEILCLKLMSDSDRMENGCLEGFASVSQQDCSAWKSVSTSYYLEAAVKTDTSYQFFDDIFRDLCG